MRTEGNNIASQRVEPWGNLQLNQLSVNMIQEDLINTSLKVPAQTRV